MSWIALGALLVGCSGCGGDASRAEGLVWVRLAGGYGPEAPPSDWVEVEIGREDWSSGSVDNERQVFFPLPARAQLVRSGAETMRLEIDGKRVPWVEARDRRHPDFVLGHGAFECWENLLLLVLPDQAKVPERATLSVRFERGVDEDGVWRASVGNVFADGLSVWPGEGTEVEAKVPQESALRFQTAASALPGAELRFRVLLDGEELHASTLVAREEVTVASHVVALPAHAWGKRGVFRFEVEGADGMTAFLEPVLGPASIGDYGQRPWESARPDVVLFLIDTFRADNLAAYGGKAELAPNLNALVDRSLTFLDARSPSVWTLPSHASMFTGLFPLQHGAVTRRRTFSREFLTVAEHFSALGYRTGAITDAAFVSRDFSMDQGFQWFEERDRETHDLTVTFRNALQYLDRDDGRPVFLFVHTYRVHEPYRVGLEEDPEPVRELELEVLRLLQDWEGAMTDELETILRGKAEEYRAIYHAGVRAFDEELGPWLQELERRDLFQEGLLLVTSDHGEEFFEHRKRRHGGKPHEEKIRIPLLLFGGGIEPGFEERAAGLCDVPRTLAAFAGLPPAESWGGTSLLTLQEDRLHFAYNGDADGSGNLAVVSGDHKLFARGAPNRLSEGIADLAFDLATDPGEQAPLDQELVDWARELARRAATEWDELQRPLRDADAVELGSGALEDLRDLGYAE